MGRRAVGRRFPVLFDLDRLRWLRRPVGGTRTRRRGSPWTIALGRSA